MVGCRPQGRIRVVERTITHETDHRRIPDGQFQANRAAYTVPFRWATDPHIHVVDRLPVVSDRVH